jgi:hypothetical protein
MFAFSVSGGRLKTARGGERESDLSTTKRVKVLVLVHFTPDSSAGVSLPEFIFAGSVQYLASQFRGLLHSLSIIYR